MEFDNTESSKIEQHYTGGNYWSNREDSDASYKIDLLDSFLQTINLDLYHVSDKECLTISEIGCGQGAFLFPLANYLTEKQIAFKLTGYDIASQAIELAKSRNKYSEKSLSFCVGSSERVAGQQDIIFIMDVLEHVANPILFLEDFKGKSKYLIIHLPIEQSLFHLLFSIPNVSYKTFKHIHFFSWETANILIKETPFSLVNYQFTAASKISLTAPGSLPIRIFRILRYIIYQISPKFASMVMGGSVLLLLENNKH
jgi:SAM-dependent methyltransferase